ncbi:MAG: 50S ribosomal protein L11 methyltransferase [Opitutales bacterium]
MIEVRVTVDAELAERLEAHFCEWLRSPWSLLQEKTGIPYQFSGYFDDESEALHAWRALQDEFPELPESPQTRLLEDADWQNAYKAFMQPWQERHVHWVPLWERATYRLPEGHVALYLDAGMAFGTGSHETTRLCLRRLLDFREARPKTFAQTRLIDAGCGSGILALTAYKLGWRTIAAFDRDPEAVRVSRENESANDLPAGAVDFFEAALEDGLRDRQADLVLANIQADVLMLHGPDLLQSVGAGGWLVLSGILAVEWADTAAFFHQQARLHWSPETARPELETMGEWSILRLVRPA